VSDPKPWKVVFDSEDMSTTARFASPLDAFEFIRNIIDKSVAAIVAAGGEPGDLVPPGDVAITFHLSRDLRQGRSGD